MTSKSAPSPVSVIIPAYRAAGTLRSVLAALRPQAEGRVEVIVVDSSGPPEAAKLEAEHPWLTVVAPAQRTLPGEARNLGAERAAGAWLAFLDADAVPAPDWLARLEAALAEATRKAALDGRLAPVAVAGAVANGTPDDAVGTASYLLEFSEFIPGRRGHPRHAASCNLLVERVAFEAAGGFVADLWPGEDTVLTVPWAQQGRLEFAHEAVVTHLNRTRIAELMRHQIRLGRSFAAVCDTVEFPYRRFSRWPLLAAAPVLRLVALALRLRGRPVSVARAARAAPSLVYGLAGWTVGLAAVRRRDGRPGSEGPGRRRGSGSGHRPRAWNQPVREVPAEERL